MTDFKWAFGEKAILKEPIKDLKENGWQYGDIPSASNFNWIFHEIEKEFFCILSEARELKENLVVIKEKAEKALDQSIRNENKANFNFNVAFQISRELKKLVADLRTLGVNVPDYAWPEDN